MKCKKGRFIKVIISCMLIYLLLFTCACLYISYTRGTEPQTLILCVFAFCGVEGGLSAWIRTTKEKKKYTLSKKDV